MPRPNQAAATPNVRLPRRLVRRSLGEVEASGEGGSGRSTNRASHSNHARMNGIEYSGLSTRRLRMKCAGVSAIRTAAISAKPDRS